MNNAVTNKKIKIKTEFLTQIRTKMAKYKEIYRVLRQPESPSCLLAEQH